MPRGVYDRSKKAAEKNAEVPKVKGKPGRKPKAALAKAEVAQVPAIAESPVVHKVQIAMGIDKASFHDARIIIMELGGLRGAVKDNTELVKKIDEVLTSAVDAVKSFIVPKAEDQTLSFSSEAPVKALQEKVEESAEAEEEPKAETVAKKQNGVAPAPIPAPIAAAPVVFNTPPVQ